MRLNNIHPECLAVLKLEYWDLAYVSGIPYLELKHPSGFYVTIEERPPYCDRGNWIAKITDPGEFWIDAADGWPRYYFDLKVAISEINAFIMKRQANMKKEGAI